MEGSRLKALRIHKQMTQQQLADLLHVDLTTIGKWENHNNTPGKDLLLKLSGYFEVTTDYLLGVGDISSQGSLANQRHAEAIIFARGGGLITPMSEIKTRKVPFLGEIACGKPIYADAVQGVYVETDITGKFDFCLRAKGDSMIGAGIREGDIVFCLEQPTVNNGEIGVVIIGDEATLKRVVFSPERQMLILNSENPAYSPLVYVGEELSEARIIGRAVAVQCSLH